MQDAIIELKHVNIYQGTNLVLQDVNLRVQKGGVRVPRWKDGYRKIKSPENPLRRSTPQRRRLLRCGVQPP